MQLILGSYGKLLIVYCIDHLLLLFLHYLLNHYLDSLHVTFLIKISNLRSLIINDSSPTARVPGPSHSFDELSNFTLATTEEVIEVVLDSQDKQCELDPIPTSLLKKCIHLLPY